LRSSRWQRATSRRGALHVWIRWWLCATSDKRQVMMQRASSS
jgi:hypothetical protein